MFTPASGTCDPRGTPASNPFDRAPLQEPYRNDSGYGDGYVDTKRLSSRVSQPPGGASSFSIGGFDNDPAPPGYGYAPQQPQPARDDSYGAQLRAQMDERAASQRYDRLQRGEAERADDRRVSREAADLRREVEGEIAAQRGREATVRAREASHANYMAAQNSQNSRSAALARGRQAAPDTYGAIFGRAPPTAYERPSNGTGPGASNAYGAPVADQQQYALQKTRRQVDRDAYAANRDADPYAFGGQASGRGDSSNAYANGANQNCGNVITDRSSTRVMAPPGGRSSITFG